jgi:hypothetical protein
MEIVDVGSIEAEDAIRSLLEGESLRQLADGHAVACFALPGPPHSQAFHEALIETSRRSMRLRGNLIHVPEAASGLSVSHC